MTASHAKASDAIHKEIANRLRFGGIKKEHLDELVGLVAEVYQQGLTQLNVNTKGLPPDLLTVEVSGLASAGNIGSVLTGILTKVPRYNGVVVFPYGIINPETYQISVEFGVAEG